MSNEIVTSIHGDRLGLDKDDNLIVGRDKRVVSTLNGSGQVQSVSNTTSVGIGAAAGTGVTAAEYGGATIHKTVLTFVNTPVVLADNAGVVAYGSLKIYDFPEGIIQVLGATSNLALTKSSVGVNADWDGDFSLGTAAANNGATLLTTEQNVIPSTSTAQAVAGVTTAVGGNLPATVPTVLTDNSAGAVDNTIQAMANPTDTPATADVLRDDIVAVLLPSIRNNIADLAGKINEILALMTGNRILFADGHTTPVDLYVNILVDDADHDVTGTACNIILNGTVTFSWINHGDYT